MVEFVEVVEPFIREIALGFFDFKRLQKLAVAHSSSQEITDVQEFEPVGGNLGIRVSFLDCIHHDFFIVLFLSTVSFLFLPITLLLLPLIITEPCQQ